MLADRVRVASGKREQEFITSWYTASIYGSVNFSAPDGKKIRYPQIMFEGNEKITTTDIINYITPKDGESMFGQPTGIYGSGSVLFPAPTNLSSYKVRFGLSNENYDPQPTMNFTLNMTNSAGLNFSMNAGLYSFLHVGGSTYTLPTPHKITQDRNVDYTITMTDGTPGGWLLRFWVLTEDIVSIIQTTSPKLLLAGMPTEFAGALGDGVQTDWLDIAGFTDKSTSIEGTIRLLESSRVNYRIRGILV